MNPDKSNPKKKKKKKKIKITAMMMICTEMMIMETMEMKMISDWMINLENQIQI